VRENVAYSKAGFFQDIPFKATDDSSPKKTVESSYLQEWEWYNDTMETVGWNDTATEVFQGVRP